MREQGKYSLAGWVRADSPVRVAEDLAALAPSLDLAAKGPPGEVAAAVVAALGSRTDWLVVFDNAQAPSDVTDVLPAAGGHILITSRNRVWGEMASQLDLKEFDRGESVAFLQRRAGCDEPEAAGQLAEELGDLPLALAQAAAYIDTHGLTVSSYLALYRNPEIGRRLRAEGLESREYRASVAATWLLHFDRLHRERPAAVELLRLCAYLDSNGIDLDIFAGEADHAGEVLAPVITDRFERAETVGALARASLVTVAAGGRLRIHRLVQAVTRDQLDNDQARAWAQKVLILATAAFPATSQEPRSWPVCAALAPQLEAVLAHAESYPELAGPRGELLGALATYLTATAQYSAAFSVQKRALAIKEAFYGPDHPDVARALGNLGVIQRNLEDLEAALSSHARALAIEEAHHGPSHPDVAWALGNLGVSQRHIGNLDAALKSQERALEIKEAHYGSDHPEVAKTLGNLGNIQQNLGNPETALRSHERALDIEEAHYGHNHPDVGKTLGNLGIIQQDLGNLEIALSLQERALEITQASYGLDHPEVARTLGNLGIIQRILGDREGARNSLERGLSITESAYGPDHPEVAKTLGYLCLIQRDLGDMQAALGCQERALAIKEAAFGLNHPEVAKALGNLGILQRTSGGAEAARSSFERALAIFQATYGPDHPDTRRAARQVST
jgi:tetratricopeptide (TPR) repeat protein